MFTGIVAGIGSLVSITNNGKEAIIEVDAHVLDFNDIAIGDSIACNGVCVTVVTKGNKTFTANISHETLACTTFKYLKRGSLLNLEMAVTPTTHLGGHIMQGHVDGVGTISSIKKTDDVLDVWVDAPSDIAKYIAHKGSIAVDGISLTVNEVKDSSFRLTLIPHTHAVTTADNWEAGDKVNVEIDVLARYLERMLSFNDEKESTHKSVWGNNVSKKSQGLTKEKLFENGFF